MDTEQQNAIERALKALKARQEAYSTYARYYDGDHPLAFATDKFRNAFGDLFRAFADNLCPSVVDVAADRLQLTGFQVDGNDEASKAIASQAWDIWTANRMDRRSGEAHSEALKMGDAYVIVWPDANNQPVLFPNRAAMTTVAYDPEQPGRRLWAAKWWTLDDGKVRLNLFYPDRIEKYVTTGKSEGGLPDNGGSFMPFEVVGETWPLPNTWGEVPVFHFANNAGIGEFGRSELRDVLPLQNALNKAISDMLVAMEFVALPQRWATGLEVPINATTGKAEPIFDAATDRVWSTADERVKFGQFAAADLTQFHGTQDTFRREIATVSRTPLHYVIPPSGQWPSGAALQTAEAAFTAKVKDRQVAMGNTWEDALRLALRMANAGDTMLSALWKDPTPRAELDQANAALIKKQLGVSDQQLQREFGYSEDDIQRMADEAQLSAADTADRLLTAFERGQ